jgi:hypothetical protein
MSRLGVLVIVSAFAAACTAETTLPAAPMSAPVFQSGSGAPASLSGDSTTSSPATHGRSGSPHTNGGNFGTPLSAGEEPPVAVVNDSPARGNAIFQLSADGTSLAYRLIVANIENVTQAHIHTAAPGVNGPIVVWLYPDTSPPADPPAGGRLDGVIATGTITAVNLIGPLAGQPLSALVALIQNGLAYVNVHTSMDANNIPTGPGDFPGGEIRGQLEHRGH